MNCSKSQTVATILYEKTRLGSDSPTWVTFSVTFCVRSVTLCGAMISISVVEPEWCFSRLNSTKLRVNCGIWLMVRYFMKSESDVAFWLCLTWEASGEWRELQQNPVGLTTPRTIEMISSSNMQEVRTIHFHDYCNRDSKIAGTICQNMWICDSIDG